ncbi:MAG: UDP-N-acetylglucosamine 2-epimerase [Ramlibacter sp.]
MRKVLYVTGTRADFGLMVSTLQRIHAHPALQLQVAVTGMHLDAAYGLTVREIEALGLPIVARVPVDVQGRSGAAMARAIGQAVIGLTEAFEQARPDLVVVIGDRGEMLAAAIAAIHLGIPVVHLHGGERSGTVDESVRHALTKLSHWHFVASEESRQRVVRLGERPEHVWITGAPSLDGVQEQASAAQAQLPAALGLPADAAFVLVLFHPVLQEAGSAEAQTQAVAAGLADALAGSDRRIVWLAPNADAGSGAILDALDRQRDARIVRLTHLPRPLFLAALQRADALVGNSSAGIIESASLGTPVVNIGNRQRARERNANTIDCAAERGAIADALARALAHGRFAPDNRYGDGSAGARITELLATLPIEPSLLDKINTH